MTTHSRGIYTQHRTGRYDSTPKQCGGVAACGTEEKHPRLKSPHTLRELMDYVGCVPRMTQYNEDDLKKGIVTDGMEDETRAINEME